MLSSFFPADRLESYRTSPYKDRIDRIGQRLVEQRYHPEVTAQHLREWLRVARYLQAQEFRLPLALDAHSGEIDHPFRPKPITHSGRNRSPIPAETDHPSGARRRGT